MDNFLIASLAIPVIFMALIFASGTVVSQVRMCVYVIIASLAVMNGYQQGAKPLFLISIIVVIIGLALVLKLNTKKDIEDA
tara:strand:- start:1623 stop:1865 length:243 start_codon:yes stop_codon:yes gene_type:complete